jgi:branched-chain amino acid transport system ATP-binding protein
VDLDVGPGDGVAVVGPNGAGKSTLVKAISGVARQTSGSIEFGGVRIDRWSPERRVAAGIVQVPEGRHVFPGLSVAENLWLGSYVSRAGSELREQVLDLFPRLRERLRQEADRLSGGEQQMLALARGLMARPRLLMIDEPTLGLAPVLVDHLIDSLRAMRSTFKLALLVVEQNAYLTRELCDRTYVLVNGTIVRSGLTEELTRAALMESYAGGAPVQEGL